MTPERLEQIRAAITEKPVGELEHVLPELLDALDASQTETDDIRRTFRQFLAELGSYIAGAPVTTTEALRRVAELVRERETE